MVPYLSRLCGRIMIKEILTLKETAQYLRVHPRTIHRMVVANKLPHFRVGTRYRFLKSVLIQWMWEKTNKGEPH